MRIIERCRTKLLVLENAHIKDGLSDELLQGVEQGFLSSYICAQRWFGRKGQALGAVWFDEMVVFPDQPAMGLAQVGAHCGAQQVVYQLPLHLKCSEEGYAEEMIIARVLDASGRQAILLDGLCSPMFRHSLGRLMQGGSCVRGRRNWLLFDKVDADGLELSQASSRILGVEQSNTSVVYGERALFKLYRCLDKGPNPDTEVSSFLATRARFMHTPQILGSLRYVDGHGGHSVAGMLQAFVASQGDGWSLALTSLGGYLTGAAAGERGIDFVECAAQLGGLTRALHDALASDPHHPDFAPEPVAAEQLKAWANAVAAEVRANLALLKASLQRHDFPTRARDAAAQLLQRQDEALACVSDLAGGLVAGAGARMRHHGDYHLGQVLRRDDGAFVVLDFEGEPVRCLAERRQKHSPLRDVAGMLRSFAYAGATAAATYATVPHVTARAQAWCAAVGAAFWRAYLGNEPLPDFLPPTPALALRLVRFFELAKAFYELRYEICHRPTWVWIPLRGIMGVLDEV